jgi:hypothetical protein
VSLHPSELRAGDWFHLAELDYNGHTIRVAETPVAGLPFGDLAASVDYIGGLDIGGSAPREIDLFADTPSSRNLNATLDLSRVMDIPALVLSGHTLLGAAFRVYLHPAGSTSRQAVFTGEVTAFEFERKDDPVTLTASASLGDDVGTVHGPWDKQRHIDIVRDDEQQDTWLPVVFGAPGNGSASSAPEDHMFGGPGFGMTQLVAPLKAAIVSSHLTKAGDTSDTVFWWNKTKDYSGSVTVSHLDTVRGSAVSIVDITGAASPEWETGDEIWIDWGGSDGGMMSQDGTLIRGAGDVLHWMATRARGLTLDLPRIESAKDVLNRYKIDAAIWGADGETVRPMEWVNEYLVPMLPISAVMGPEGLYFAVWRPDATKHDAVAAIDAKSGGNAVRMGEVESTDLEDVANDITVRYGVDAKSGKATKERRVTGDQEVAAEGGTIRRGIWAQRSHHRLGQRIGKSIELPAVWDDATAEMSLMWLERRSALPSYSVSYRVRPELAYLYPGAVATLTDPNLGLTARVCLVEVVTPERSGNVMLRLRLYAEA